MIREAICEGSDVEEALKKAKAALGIGDTDEYDFEVLQREEKKRFGLFGGKPAKVRAFVVIQEKAEDKTERFLRDVLDKMIQCLSLRKWSVSELRPAKEEVLVLTIKLATYDIVAVHETLCVLLGQLLILCGHLNLNSSLNLEIPECFVLFHKP